MAESNTLTENKTYAVVTGANKGIGLEICRLLASRGVTVVLTARDEKRGTEALEKLKDLGLSDNVVFHQLDVLNDASISSLDDFVKAQFGRLDILVNNAGINGAITDIDALKAELDANKGAQRKINWTEITTETYEQAVECLQTNYYGPKRIIETFIPLLNLSKSPRIVNVSSSYGKLKKIPSEEMRAMLNSAEIHGEERLNEVLNKFLRDFHEGSLQAKGWPNFWSAYTISKATLNSYTRILAKKYPDFCINCVCPGFVKTDLTFNLGLLTCEEGAESVVRLAQLPDGGPSGLYRNEACSFE